MEKQLIPALRDSQLDTGKIRKQSRTENLYFNIFSRSDFCETVFQENFTPVDHPAQKIRKQAGTGPSRRHTQSSKIAKVVPSVNLQYSKIEKPKNGLSGAPESVNIFVAVEGTLWRKKQILEKSHNAEKLKGGILRDFSTSIRSQNSKKIEGGPLGEKNFRKKVSLYRK